MAFDLLFDRARRHGSRTAILDAGGRLTYGELADRSCRAAGRVLSGRRDLSEARVAFLVPPGSAHVVTQWAIWRAGGVAVPLAPLHSDRELAQLLDDAAPVLAVADAAYAARLESLASPRNIPIATVDDLLDGPELALPAVTPGRRALMVYTSGTTARPKGVVTTHANLTAQITTLVSAWGWDSGDHILHVLPLHHVHGIVNALCCALWCGACCELAARFDPVLVWDRLAAGEITLFMAVPTIYGRLIAAWDAAPPAVRARWSAGAARLRLMVSGSAALPVATLERWRAITGHTLLERYGMTEIGMALSNPLAGERRAGTVGRPLPGVEVRLVDERGAPVPAGTAGEIEVKGPQVFLEYWDRPDDTRRAFRGGWFRTGDVAVVEHDYYRILGRESTDIIKAGGYKISALEIEEVLRGHPRVADCAVVGLPDPDLGERVAAAVTLRDAATAVPDDLAAWAAERLAPYKRPREIRVVAELPRNAMGKVTKPAVRALLDRPAA